MHTAFVIGGIIAAVIIVVVVLAVRFLSNPDNYR